jgi:hypothetical protein
MMVKRTAPPLACALCLCLGLAGCAGARRGLAARVQAAVLAPGRLAGPVSLLPAEGGPWAVFSDRETTSLALARVPDGPLPAQAPAPRLIDRIDSAPPPSATFGEHAAAASAGSVAALYLDREREDHTVLKLASGPADGADWRLDILEPPGRPVAVIPLPGGRFGSVWAGPSSLLYRPPGGPDQILRTGFSLQGRACPIDDGRGFTVFDRVTARLLWFRMNVASFDSGEINGPGPVHASVLLPGSGAGGDGPAGADRLAVVSYDPGSRRIFLDEQQPSGAFARTTVTVCDGTTWLFLAPWGRGYLFLYDDVRPMGGGRTLAELSLLAPDGPRYRRTVISSGEEPLWAAAALAGDGVLTVAVLRESLAVLRITPPPPAGRR